MTLKKKTISIVLSLMIAVTFMPITGQVAFAVESDSPETVPPEVTQPAPTFNPGGVVYGVGVIGFNYKSVTIGWAACDMAEGYQVYSATRKKGKYRCIRTTAGLSCYDKKNKRLGKKRYYKIRAFGTVNGRRVYSGFSGIISAKPNIPAPSAWTSGGTNKITVAWNKVAGATRYQVYRANSMYGKYKRLTTTKKKSYTGKAITPNKRYYYKVRALRGSKKGYYTGAIEGITILPAPPVVYASTNPNGGINVSWSGIGNAAGYQIFRSTHFSSGFQHIGTAGATSFTDTDASLVSGTNYYYKVRAYASLNGRAQFGYMSSGSQREAAVAQAAAWVGAREGSGTQKQIISIYNSKTRVGKISYKTPWCAAFVSAVGINSGNSAVIPIDNYCPRMLMYYPGSARRGSTYVPTSGDLTFFDWNRNGVPDHVGIVNTANDQTVSTIEGNTTINNTYPVDGVYVRSYGTEWARSNVLSYCIPAYSDNGRVTYSYSKPEEVQAASIVENPVEEAVVEEAVEVVEGGKAPATEEQKLQEPEIEQEPQMSEIEQEPQMSEIEQEPQMPAIEQEPQAPETDREAVEALMTYIEEVEPAEKSPAEESTFNAFLVLEACDDMGIGACVVTKVGENGEEKSYNEIIIDGERYLVDATKEGSTPIKYIPEKLN